MYPMLCVIWSNGDQSHLPCRSLEALLPIYTSPSL